MDLAPLRDLADHWRDQAELFAADGVPGHAALLRRVAGELEDVLRTWWVEPLRLQRAAEEAGYSETRLRELVRAGSIPDGRPPGSQGPITIRRSDLPRKPGAAAPKLDPVDELAELIQPGRTA